MSICGDEDTVVSIHDYLNANRGHISQTVFRLCQRGYVTAQQDQKDRRYTHYRLTVEGMNIAAQIKLVWNRIIDEMFEGISDEDIETFKKVSLKVSQNIKEKLK